MTNKLLPAEDRALLEDALGLYLGDCVEYRGGEIYGLDIDERACAFLDGFRIDEGIAQAAFGAR